MQSSSYRLAHWRAWAALGLVLLVLAVLGGMIWRNIDRLDTYRDFTIYQHRIQRVAIDIQETLTQYFAYQTRQLDAQRLARLSAEIAELSREDRHVAPQTPGRLSDLSHTIAALASEDTTPKQQEARLLHALAITGDILDDENLQRAKLVEALGSTTRAELELALATVAGLLLLMGLFLRRRILAPLRDLELLLLRLAREDFTPIETLGIDPLLKPVFGNYNLMVQQLGDLKEAERRHAESLEAEVRSATQALLEQQAGLARNERLAAVGELAAGIAHELRNPLAGIQMACGNLRDEIGNPEQAERIALIIGELKRMGRLLNELLDQAKHTPAPVENFDLAAMLRALVALTRYQVAPEIRLEVEVSGEMPCRLPECRLRQCLLNLILNAAEAIGRAPGTIRIEARPEGETIALTVADTGPGFPPELLERGIRPFATGRPGGTGLGLAMVQRLVRDLDGHLTLANLEPHGAYVRLLVPVRHG